jgi:hypothetical protein
MSDGITGKVIYKCKNCGAKHYLHDDFYFEVEFSSERSMGEEVQYLYEQHDHSQLVWTQFPRQFLAP